MDLLPLLMMLVNTLNLLSLYILYAYSCLFLQALMKKFIALGTKCAEYLKVARASEGKFCCLVSACPLLIPSVLFLFDSFFFCNVGALAVAKARIASLEAELSASRKAYDAVTAAKTAADKSQKLALAKAKKAEKALADAEKEHRLREQAVAERLQAMSTAAEGTYSAFSLFRLPFVFC
jgi:hypothetical protein